MIQSSPDPPEPSPTLPAAPQSPDQLHQLIHDELGFNMPRHPRFNGHQTPFDYLTHAFFEHNEPRDCIVWANRGGGKTQLGAIATLLDLVYKPGIQIRILGGSRDQSSRMYEHLTRLLNNTDFGQQCNARITAHSVVLPNGSRADMLSQSERAVRGQRVHKLRCDEIELFDPDVWSAAQLVTRSGQCGATFVLGCIEAFSTMHRPYGLMHQLINETADTPRCVFRWNAIDLMEQCPDERLCESCDLLDACDGRAKQGIGFIPISDVLQQRQRVSTDTWLSEMLCERPSRKDLVYPAFRRQRHVVNDASPDPNDGHINWIAGMDFGYRDPTVLLWACIDLRTDVLTIVDELCMREVTVNRIIHAADRRPWPRPLWIAADPSGRRKNDQTGLDAFTLWKHAGWKLRARHTRILPGIAAVTRRIDPGLGDERLRIHPRCTGLINALETYHYPPDAPGDAVLPAKDGPDHYADALRYLITNLDTTVWSARHRSYV